MNRRNKKKYLVYTNKKYLVSIYSLFKESEKNYMHATFQNIPVFFFLIFDNFNGQQINYINFI